VNVEEFRLQYPLTNRALVLDAGAFRGDFIDWCRKRWDCRVVAFEPCTTFADGVQRRFGGDPKVQLRRYGLSNKTEWADLSVLGDATSVFASRADAVTERIELRDVVEVLGDPQLQVIDLFKINIEGGEYPLLERMIGAGLAARVGYFQIQFHGFGSPDPGAARDRIREALSATHREEWCVNGGQWESWARRT
jgi:FkbM family methyltransferase